MGLNQGVRQYASQKVEAVGSTSTLEEKLIEAVQNPPQQPDKNSDQIILFIAISKLLLELRQYQVYSVFPGVVGQWTLQSKGQAPALQLIGYRFAHTLLKAESLE